MTVLVVTAVEAEAKALAMPGHVMVVVGGIGRVNAAAAATEAILRNPGVTAVISAGVAGILPGADLRIGDTLLADSCVYAEEGIETPGGFQDMTGLGFPLGDFPGNRVPVDPVLLESCRSDFPTAPIATVATCSGTTARAQLIARQTGAAAEAMEGAAVVHAARRLGLPALEIRAMSNTTGDRQDQQWDLQAGLAALGDAVEKVVSGIPG
ncbi:MAG: futalosine hydrolase [Phycisphaerales bacterium]|nr:futalosine hydrolase [Phycisphaerales bacterium]